MPKRINMPKLSDTMEEGTLIAWRKAPGDPVRRGDILAEIETDKADMEFESYTEGSVHALLIEPGQAVAVGTPIAIIRLASDSEEDLAAAAQGAGTRAAPAAAPREPARSAVAGPSVPAAAPAPAPARPAPTQLYTPMPQVAPPRPPAVGGERVTPASFDDGRLRASPRARRLAAERSIDLSEIEGTGPFGAILISDIESYLKKLEEHAEEPEGVRATPLALRMAGDLGLSLEGVKGSGPGGRVTKTDVLTFQKRAAERAKEREGELFRSTTQLSQKRKALIRNMVRSKEKAPHFYVQMDVHTDPLTTLRDQINQESGTSRPRLTYTHLIVKASALALEAFPEANATYREEEGDIALYEPINIGVAVDVNDELVAPTIKHCQGKSAFQLAEEANALIQRARMRKLSPQDYSDGTFTISNLGMFGVDVFYAIVTPPQSSILSVSALQQRPIVRGGELAIGGVTTLGLSVDHRVLDGVKAAKFLGHIKHLLENPQELLKESDA